mgnify:CR=1 FL=1
MPDSHAQLEHTHRALEMWRDEAGDECDLTENPLLCERFTSLLLSTLVLVHHSTVLFWFCLYS